MNLGQAVTFAFEDREWVSKLLIIAMVTFLSLVTLPFLVGFFPLAVALGYMLEIATNVRDDRRSVLPLWEDFSERLNFGAGLLAGLFVYNLPLLALSCCLLFPSGVSDQLVGGLLYLTLLCCALPYSVVHITITWPMLAVGASRYLRTRRVSSFFQFGSLWDAMVSLWGASFQWLVCVLLVNALFVLLSATFVGLLPALALLLPVHGHLLGQYAALVQKRDTR